MLGKQLSLQFPEQWHPRSGSEISQSVQDASRGSTDSVAVSKGKMLRPKSWHQGLYLQSPRTSEGFGWCNGSVFKGYDVSLGFSLGNLKRSRWQRHDVRSPIACGRLHGSKTSKMLQLTAQRFRHHSPSDPLSNCDILTFDVRSTCAGYCASHCRTHPAIRSQSWKASR